MKDLFDELNDVEFISSNEYEYCCPYCGYESDQCSYEKLEQEYDYDGYPIGEEKYIEVCVNCNQLLGEL